MSRTSSKSFVKGYVKGLKVIIGKNFFGFGLRDIEEIDSAG